MYKISGESRNVDLERVEQWKLSLKTLLIGYDLKNVFNMDETSFFFRALLDSTLSHVKQLCKGGKQGKDRITMVLTCSALGVFCIGREIAAMDSRQIQELKNISQTKHEKIESQVYKQCESLDDKSDLQSIPEGV